MVSKFCVLGERVSGTCFLNSLPAQNVAGLKPVVFKHKHWFQNLDDIRRADTSGTVFIYITREPISWLNSLCKTPFHVHGSLRHKDLSRFMRTEWHCVEDESSGVSQNSRLYGKEMLHERCPETGERFANVIKMRSAKIRHTMALDGVVENFVHVALEDVQRDPELFLSTLCRMHNLRRRVEFSAVETVRGKGRVVYVPSLYPELSERDQDFIVQQLDLAAEAMIAYC